MVENKRKRASGRCSITEPADTVGHRGKQQGGSDVRKKLRYPTGGEDSEEGEEEGRKAHKHELFSGIGHPYD